MDYTNYNTTSDPGSDSASHRFQNQRMVDRVSSQKGRPKRPGAFYHRQLQHYHKLMIPKGLRILEIGCGPGDLLACLKPAFGVGIDFSEKMIRQAHEKHPHLYFMKADAHALPVHEKFDAIILSDLVNDLWDVQQVLEQLRNVAHPGTRLVLNFYNNLWRLPLAAVKLLRMGADVLEQNWFAPQDIFNLLQLSGFELIQRRPVILLPVSIPWISNFVNRFLVHLPPFSWLAMANIVIGRPAPKRDKEISATSPSVSVIIPARNEAGNIESILQRLPRLGDEMEIIFVEGHSNDSTYEIIRQAIKKFPGKKCKLFQQTGQGKGDAVRLGFEKAVGQILIILDADMTVPPEDLIRFYKTIVSGKGEFINGVRLVYPLEDQAMRFLNMIGNKFFSLTFSWLLGQPIKDTLCGTKVLWTSDYKLIKDNRAYFGNFDPFGDFDLLFGAAKLNLKIVEMPIRYRSRTYGDTNISRWRHFLLLLKMVIFAAKRIKFI
jgi:SAM-dependent methyltransferase